MPAVISGDAGILGNSLFGLPPGRLFRAAAPPSRGAAAELSLRKGPDFILWGRSQGGGVGDCTAAAAPPSFMGEGQETSAA